MSNYGDTFNTGGRSNNLTDQDGHLIPQNNQNDNSVQDLFRDAVCRVHTSDMESETLKFCIEQSLNGISIGKYCI